MTSQLEKQPTACNDWHRALSRAVRDPEELIDRLALGEPWRQPARQAARLFSLLVPESYLHRMQAGNPHDPLLRQVLPLAEEWDEQPGFLADAVDEAQARKAPGLLQKYAGRALLIAAGSCAVHCRYCFRRHYPYEQEPRRLEDWQPALEAIRGDTSLEEIILSGGDPLMLTDRRLADLVDRLAAIEHLRRLRIHTRLPIVLPERITEPVIDLLTVNRLTPIVVVHANHPAEIVGDCAEALRRLVQAGLTVLNQAVLLKGVNDSAGVLTDLCRRLVDLGVIPYYLHQLDRVAGTAHFEVSEETGRQLVSAIRRQLPGYAVPELVREVPGEDHKTPLM